MEFTLKPLSQEAVPRALAKAERYRLLNEPGEAESICRDALAAEPENQDALRSLLLSVSDQFGNGLGARVSEARDGDQHDRDEKASRPLRSAF